MGTFNKQQILDGSPSLIPAIASRIEKEFSADGFTVQNQSLISGSSDISITKGNAFKAVLGMKTALKVTLRPQGSRILFDAGVGVFGQQAIPTVISMLFFWPVLITQIWGLVQQSKLDDKALEIAETVVHENGNSVAASLLDQKHEFCVSCGKELPADSVFCPRCGKMQ